MRPRKKILLIVTRAELGGAQNHISSIVNELHKEIDFVLCVGTKGLLIDSFKALNLPTYIIPSLDKKRFLSSAISIASIITNEKPDLVHTHSAVASFIGRIIAKIFGIKTLYTVHGWHFTPNSVNARRLIGPFLEFFARPFTNHWITVSEYDKILGSNKLVISKHQCTVIVNGVKDIALPTKSQKTTNTLNVAFIGRATYQKNCLAAVRMLFNCNERINLSIFSANGDHLENLRTYISSHNLSDRVRLIDNENEAGQQLVNFDLLLMTSLYEGMPLCALEAMRASLPIIATDVCGMNEIVKHGENGYLYNLDDEKQASLYLNELLENPSKRKNMGRNSRTRFEENYLEKDMVNKTHKVYKKLFNNL